jgi:transcriptional regulator with XRE-family HTH domain
MARKTPGERIQMRIGHRIRESREERGWTQVELAQRACIDNSTVSRIEGGHTKRIDPDIMSRIERALDIEQGGLWSAVQSSPAVS